ncbi:MAG: phytoene/squalene synthase family protein [Phycisphaeraceae bacterium]
MTRSSHAPALPVADDAVASSFAYCAQLTRAKAKNFYYGMMLTPEPRRSAMYAIHAWMRAVDDLADGEGELEGKRRALEAFRRRTHAVMQSDAAGFDDREEPVARMWPAVGRTLKQYTIAARDLDDMIDGQLLDQTRTRYETFAELYDYCYKVASVVGLVCMQVWGFEGGAATQKLAEERGIALQLTNILRDLVEDARRDRVYLPAEELAKFGFDAERFKAFILSPTPSPQFDALMEMQVARAAHYYDSSSSLESFVTPACRPTCWAMMKIYHGLLEKIRKQPRRVLTQRVALGKMQKLWIALRATWRKGLRR